VIVVFLLLAALYNSWGIPVSVLMVVPFGILGAVVFTLLRGLSADVYFNIGMITIIGLAAKNAILIVEFAIEDEDAGSSPDQATVEAARQRLRPILMTSLAFILGMVPLVIASGEPASGGHRRDGRHDRGDATGRVLHPGILQLRAQAPEQAARSRRGGRHLAGTARARGRRPCVNAPSSCPLLLPPR
jgi:hypothetical protein